jgi:hypothetical protein
MMLNFVAEIIFFFKARWIESFSNYKNKIKELSSNQNPKFEADSERYEGHIKLKFYVKRIHLKSRFFFAQTFSKSHIHKNKNYQAIQTHIFLFFINHYFVIWQLMSRKQKCIRTGSAVNC